MSSSAKAVHGSVAALVLERSEAVPALIGRHEDFLIIAGLGGTACDVGAVTGDSATSIRSGARWALPA